MFDCAGSSLLHIGLLSVRQLGPLFTVVCRLLTAVVSLVALGARARTVAVQAAATRRLWGTGSVVVLRGFSCFTACGIFPDQRLNLFSLHWQADSYPVHCQRSPSFLFLFFLIAFFSSFCIVALTSQPLVTTKPVSCFDRRLFNDRKRPTFIPCLFLFLIKRYCCSFKGVLKRKSCWFVFCIIIEWLNCRNMKALN